jgi:hypothetical protein
MKKKIDAHTEMLNARLREAAERKLTKDQRKALKDPTRRWLALFIFNDIWRATTIN